MRKIHSLKAVHEKFGISVPMLKKLILNGKIERVKIGVKNYISEEVVENYIADNTIPAGSAS